MNFFKSMLKSAQSSSEQKKRGAEDSENAQNSLFLTQASLPILKKLVPIGKLSYDQLTKLSIKQLTFPAGTVIFNRGEIAESLVYLLTGVVFLETNSKNSFLVEENTFESFHPLSSGEFRNATAICKTACTVIFIPKLAIDIFRQPYLNKRNNLQQLPERFAGNIWLQKFIAEDDIDVPSLPDIALRLKTAMEQDIGIAEVVKIVSRDPSISLNIIQIANSPQYRGIKPITTCLEAVNRLGLKTTKNLVTSISLRNLYRSRHKVVNQLSQTYWKQSINISALSYHLALLTQCVPPEEALLAGLLINIGKTPFLAYLGKQRHHDYKLEDIIEALDYIDTAMSTLILERWNFPDNMRKIPLETQNWFMAGKAKKAELSDIVLLAKYHNLLGTGKMKKLPPITSLPSYAHLKNGALTTDNSLQILHDARQQIIETMNFFNG